MPLKTTGVIHLALDAIMVSPVCGQKVSAGKGEGCPKNVTMSSDSGIQAGSGSWPVAACCRMTFEAKHLVLNVEVVLQLSLSIGQEAYSRNRKTPEPRDTGVTAKYW
eukprot:scaffold749_cov90-Skeletonema_dohrnii-CCMP3373.AAC.11